MNDHASRTAPSVTEEFPPVVYGTSALGNLFRVMPEELKLAVIEAWLAMGDRPAVIDSAGKYGAGLALESLGRCLRRLEAPPETVRIGVKLGWKRVPLTTPEPTFEPGAWFGLEHDARQCINGPGIRECWDQSRELLGEPYAPSMISVHDPDEYLAAAADEADLASRRRDIAEAYEEIARIREATPGGSIGVGTKDWRVAREIDAATRLDWVMLANCVTAYTHESEALEFIESLAHRGVPVVNSGVFNAGFLVGGEFFDYRVPSPVDDAALFAWRDAFFALCKEHGVTAAHAAIRFGLSPPGVVSVALSTTNPERVAENARLVKEPLPAAFCDALRDRGLIASDYPYFDRL